MQKIVNLGIDQMASHKVNSREEVERLISSNAEKIRSFGIEGISLFGSFQRNTEIRGESDIDLVVEFSPGRKNYNNFADLAFYLETLLGREVDLLTRESLRSATGKIISDSAVRIAI